MGSLSVGQRKRLAKEARKLAMECLTNGPEMKDFWCGCAIGTSLKRAGLWRGNNYAYFSVMLAIGLEKEFSGIIDYPGSNGILSGATRERVSHGNPTAVVIPLLAWADALEEAQP